MAKNGITREQREYILAHMNDRPRKAAARACGVSVPTFLKVVRKAGGEIRPWSRLGAKERMAKVAELYKDYSVREIMKMTGMNSLSVGRFVKLSGAEHSPECRERLRRKIIAAGMENLKLVDREKAGRKTRILRRMEEYRVWEGKPQLTRLRLKRITHRASSSKFYLRRRYGYVPDAEDPYVLHFTERTERVKNEDYFSKKYGFKFRPVNV